MEIQAQVDEVFSTVEVGEVVPHIAERIEPGAILYSSWGYEQTNVDYYLVTRVTKASCWIVPMRHVEVPSAGYSPMSGHTTPLEPMSDTGYCECRHRLWQHSEYGCSGAPQYDEDCACTEARPVPIKPAMHRIRRGWQGSECLTLTSYRSAYLWDGRALYASHYA